MCAKGSFAGPDAALHSALLVGNLLVAFWTCAPREHKWYKPLLSFLVEWTGHVLADALTHAEDARPLLWPLSERRLQSPISYWDRSRHARSFTIVEHAVSLLVVARAICIRSGDQDPSGIRSLNSRGERHAPQRYRSSYSEPASG